MSVVLAESRLDAPGWGRVRPDRRGLFGKELCDIPDEAVAAVAGHRLAGCFLGTPSTLSADLEPAVLRAFAARAASRGVALGVSLGMLNPTRPDRATEALGAGKGDLVVGLTALVEAAAELGAVRLMGVVGTEEDRFSPVIPWADQLRLTADVLGRLRPALRRTGQRLLIKTHQETTSWDAARLVEAVGSDVLGVALDPVNLMVRMEDPVAAAERLAGVIGQVHIDDARLVHDASGLHRQLCALGDGVVDWASLASTIARSDPDAWWWGEVHRAELSMPYTGDGWFDAHPEVGLAEVGRWFATGLQERRGPGPLVGDVDRRIDRAVEVLAAATSGAPA